MGDVMRRRLLDDGGGGKVGRKTFGLLKTSWLYQTKQFFDNSSLHGVRYIAEEGRPTIEKLMWFVFVLSGAIVTLIIIASLWEKFQTNPTITGLDTDFHSWDVPFPGVSICPTSPANSTLIEEYVAKKWDKVTDQTKLELYTKFVNDVANLSYATLANMAEYGKVPELRKMSQLRELLYSVVEKCEDLLKDCNWKGEAYSCCQGFKPTFTENGFCYTFNSIHVEKTWPWKSAQTVTDTQVNYIYETDSKWAVSFDVFELKNNTLKIFIHSYDELPGVDMAPQHIWNRKVNSIYFASRTTYTTNDARQLSPKQRKCVFEDEIKLPTHDKYSYWGCMTHCRMAYARSKCSCVPFFYHKVDGFPYCDVEGLSCLAEYTEDMGASMNCPCMLGCMNVVYEVEKVTDVTSERLEPLEVGFVSWPMIQYKREVLFGWVDLLVSFGGIAGLFLGFSLLSGVELVYFFTLRACCMIYRQKNTLEELQREEAERPPPEIDIGLVPSFVKNRKDSAKTGVPVGPPTISKASNFQNNIMLGSGSGMILTKQPLPPMTRTPRRDILPPPVKPRRYNRSVPIGSIPFLN